MRRSDFSEAARLSLAGDQVAQDAALEAFRGLEAARQELAALDNFR
jgi:hypothetical protein